jgi:hypothetical protein
VRLRALHWVLQQRIRSSPKFVLLVLALLGDDEGASYPSQAWLARATGRDLKTVRAALAELRALKLVSTRSRRRNLQGFTSNEYVVRIPTEALRGSRPGRHARKPEGMAPGDGGAMGQQQRTDIPVPHQRDNTAGEVVFPEGLREAEIQSIARALPKDARAAQQILDELAARMGRGAVRSPVRYAMNLISRSYAGEFVPDLGLRIAGERLANLPASTASAPGTNADARQKPVKALVAELAAKKVVPMASSSVRSPRR